ncbi:MAG: Flp family type IVb pilin [Parvibaculum sp.]|uniref:Flp family type IVb pilin n=1 Tax=Parvibaculum sp. TaxID=2024848 RepID=UPI002725883B|nr:Flp family type IVb pilin [Parvibaculum sp.]MDO8840626.1 Flp family type IVb pilin [Parvibaculum sp.]
MIGKLMNMARSFAADDSGATAIEYGLIAGGLSMVVVAAVTLVGDSIRDFLFGPVVAMFTGS